MALCYILSLLALIAAVQAMNTPGQDSRTSAQSFREKALRRSLALNQVPISNAVNLDESTFAECNETVTCPRAFQICHRNKCQCEHPSETDWQFFTGGSECRINAGRPCQPEEGTTPCNDNATCQPDPTSRTGYSCICDAGLQSDGFSCVRGYGDACGFGGIGSSCNQNALLECIEGTCQCLLGPDQIYDPVQKRCVSDEGFTCIVLDIGYLGCITGTQCYRSNDLAQYPLYGVCRKTPAANEVLYEV